MHSIRRSCQSALQSSNAVCPFANGSRRAFSRSPALHRGALPIFLTPSSPELSKLLMTLHAKVFLPQHLTKDQAKLVYRQKNRAKLEAEPIEITLGDVTLPLEHIDRNRDLPDRGKHLRTIVRQSKTQEDWENVLRIMEGFENAGIHLKTQWQEMIVRKMNEAGMQHLILKALQRSTHTGLRLRKWPVVVEVLRAVHDKAATADFELEATKKALRLAEQIVELMEDKEHMGKADPEIDLRSKPQVVALPLEMAAELAYRHDGDVEKVKKYANRLMNALKQHDFMSSDIQKLNDLAAERSFKNASAQAEGLTSLAREMYSIIPLWNSLSTARTVLDEEMPMAEEAANVQQQIREALQAGEEALGALRIRDGNEIAREEGGYAGYVKNAIRRCEDSDGDEI
ncbi:hypothetical protein BU26DRAFT_488652 [Trematosphaeria pertusa]|uniref:Uncharacterized protein n=1 Tax=Trematosphaeria pertusa TaxID=390896 RepID=A0A6A6I6Q6_9PLEO|nr:uncharacterized protein BU26DRAFT_488652 [Trematosphaeria pertusa]KAF2245909.1 hypothetical protein BU26DRAFT_488652 [Trematosphaeria pertusa]